MNPLNLFAAVKKFDSDEQGIEAIQAVLILAIAAVAFLTIQPAWDTIRQWAADAIDELLR